MKKRKMIAPFIISLCLILYFGAFIVLAKTISSMPFWLKVMFCIISAGFIGIVIYVLFERIKEIRSGEEDDLSKY